MKVRLRIPTNSDIHVNLSRWCMSFVPKNLPDLNMDVHICNKGPDRARNEIVRDFLDSKDDKLWMLDRDTVPKAGKKTINTFLTADYPLLSGVVDLMTEKGAFPSVFWKNEGEYDSTGTDSWIDSDFFSANATGAACLLLTRDLLEKMPEPWFDIDQDTGEDFFFCEKLPCVPVFSKMVCSHWKEVDLHRIRELTELAAAP